MTSHEYLRQSREIFIFVNQCKIKTHAGLLIYLRASTISQHRIFMLLVFEGIIKIVLQIRTDALLVVVEGVLSSGKFSCIDPILR